jgi:NlpC/P60 family putative phage cell wall peptidase
MTRDDIVAAARSWIGTPYAHQASAKGVGADCLGLIRGVWREVIGPEPEGVPSYTPTWDARRGREPLAEAARRHFLEIYPHAARPGDVVLIRIVQGGQARHAVILSTEERIVHAYEGHSVIEQDYTYGWRRRAAYAFRFPGVVD